MTKSNDLSLQTFDRLFAIYSPGSTRKGEKEWFCHCICGNFITVRGADLLYGHTKSCGCLQVEMTAKSNHENKTTHGDTRYPNSPYQAWKAMIKRCECPKDIGYKHYGGRGITVCQDWHDYQTFKAWAVSHGWRKGLAIDRIDNDGNYCPSNCQFLTKSENTKKRFI